MGFLTGLLWFVYIVVCFLLIFIILIQRGETGGLSSAFGGGGGETAFGVKADVTWKKATAFFAAIFVGLALLIGSLVSGAGRGSVATKAAASQEMPAEKAEGPGTAPPATPAAPPAGAPATPPPPPPPGAGG
jgi:preprotein translocase subunit SecG